MFATCYSTVSNLRWYGHQLQNIYCYFIPVFSLLIIDISLFVFSSLCSLSSLSSLFIFHSTPITKGHHLTPSISLKTTTRHRRSSVFSIPLRVLFFFFLFSFFHSHFLVVGWAMGGFGWVDWWWVDSDGQIVVHHAAPSTSYSQVTDL